MQCVGTLYACLMCRSTHGSSVLQMIKPFVSGTGSPVPVSGMWMCVYSWVYVKSGENILGSQCLVCAFAHMFLYETMAQERCSTRRLSDFIVCHADPITLLLFIRGLFKCMVCL